MLRAKHCTVEKRELIKKLSQEGKQFKFIGDLLGCSAKMVINGKNWTANPDAKKLFHGQY